MVNEKIENMNLIALRNYACQKVKSEKEWYMRCLGCLSLDDCKVGHRVVDILDKQTTPSGKESLLKQLDEIEKNGVNTDSIKYIEALRTDDPIGYLVSHGHHKVRYKAREALVKWLKRREIDYELPYSSSYGEKISKTLNDQGNPKKSLNIRQDELIDIFGNATTPEEMIHNYEARIGKRPCFSSVYRWIRIYPVLVKRYPMREMARILNGEENAQKIKREEIQKEKEPVDISNDEVTVEDFLKENELEEDKKVESSSSIEQSDMEQQFIQKRKELESLTAAIKQKIELDTLELKNLENKIRSIEETAKLFGFIIVPVKDK